MVKDGIYIIFIFIFFEDVIWFEKVVSEVWSVWKVGNLWEVFFLYRVVLMFYFFLDLMRRGEKVCWNKVEVMLGDIGIMLNCVIDDEW